MGLLSRTPAEKAVREAKRIAQRNANRAETKDKSEKASAAWHRLDNAQRAMRKR
jgi:hypothetical protein